ncbi:phosphotransferase family protein [Rhodococcus sp. Eu-32]|uniref:phosphotransferase family protein n=1 Tax=Rhodococcus sp. Eu-32 TaxID=1017319 RepID=UPI000DF208BC|nr:phosphotransferase family protein [Rhodococcus sp. Eu-32]RRQ28995.1 phosphotransferase family protein [Rhodococcus sp. Eu-32]
MNPELLDGVSTAVDAAFAEAGDTTRIAALKVLEGGHSGITLSARTTGGSAPDEVVIKVAPHGRPPRGRHDVLRQADVLDALADVDDLAVPRVLLRGYGEWTFYVMERCDGEAVEPVLDASTRVFESDTIRRRAEAAARMLGVLHNRAPEALVDSDSGAVDLAAEIDRWATVAAAAGDEHGLATIPDALRATMPPVVEPPVLVHGDYRLGNVLFDGVRPTGIIDWEIWTVTTPGVDLGWFLAFCDPGLFPGIGAPVHGMPTAGELLDQYYSTAGGRIADMEWFHAFGRFKMAAIMAHNLRRHREGRHIDPFQDELPPTIAALARSSRSILDGHAVDEQARTTTGARS